MGVAAVLDGQWFLHCGLRIAARAGKASEADIGCWMLDNVGCWLEVRGGTDDRLLSSVTQPALEGHLALAMDDRPRKAMVCPTCSWFNQHPTSNIQHPTSNI